MVYIYWYGMSLGDRLVFHKPGYLQEIQSIVSRDDIFDIPIVVDNLPGKVIYESLEFKHALWSFL